MFRYLPSFKRIPHTVQRLALIPHRHLSILRFQLHHQAGIRTVKPISLATRILARQFVAPTASHVTGAKRGEAREKLQLTPGTDYHGWRVLKVTPIPELNLTTYQLEHQTTGAQYFHVDTADTNNVFSVSFNTHPTDSTGVAHILEHTVLCGSKKFPVRDPFFNMLKRSLNTYMNAWTTPDYTSYPFATQNEKDFENLLSVYLDATFFPLIEELDFRQEGHRLEYEKLDDPTSKLQFKGVVYNEMKGVLSDPNDLFSHRLQSELFPTTTYHHNSGGDPAVIPELTYAQLREFHRTHYHPSNARFFTYGDLPLSHHLTFINDNVLRHFPTRLPKDQLPIVPPESRYHAARHVTATCPPTPGADPERPGRVCVAALTNTITEPFETFALSFVATMLLNGPNAPLYRALIESGFGTAYAPFTGYDHSGYREAPFGIGATGVRTADIDKFDSVVTACLQKAVAEGFPEWRVESVLHQIELATRHVTASFGMAVLSAVLPAWAHGGDPADSLKVEEHVAALRTKLRENPRFFQEKVQQWLLDNPHRVTLVMLPDPEFAAREAAAEETRLRTREQQLSDDDKRKIVAMATALKQRQETPPKVDLLPTVHLADIPREAPHKALFDITRPRANNRIPSEVQWVPQPTNGIAYFRHRINIASLPQSLKPLVPLFTALLTRLGTSKRNFRELSQAIETYTGGISPKPVIAIHAIDVSKPHEEALQVFSYALNRNVDRMFELLTEVLIDNVLLVRPFDRFSKEEVDRLRAVIAEITTDLQEDLVSDGHHYAMTHAASHFGAPHALRELWTGLSQVQFMQAVSAAAADDAALAAVVERLRLIAAYVASRPLSDMRSSLVAEEDMAGSLNSRVAAMAASLADRARPVPEMDVPPLVEIEQPAAEKKNVYIALPSSVNYVAKAMPTQTAYAHPDAPALKVLTRLLSLNYLHREIREKGGAYGSGAAVGDGMWTFYTYRDPNVVRSLDAFEKSLEWLRAGISDRDLDEAKIGIFSDIDKPISPSDAGQLFFSRRITDQMRQKYRDRLFAVDKKDLVDAAQRHLANASSRVTVFGNDQGNHELKDHPEWAWTTLEPPSSEEDEAGSQH